MVKKIDLDDRTEQAKDSKGLEVQGTEVHATALYGSQENERPKQMNCIIRNCIRTLKVQAGSLECFWAEHMYSVCNAGNRVPCLVCMKTGRRC